MSVGVGNYVSVWTDGHWTSADTTPPSPAPTGTLAVASGTVTVTLTNTGETGATRYLERRPHDPGDNDAWTQVDSTTTVTSGQTLTDAPGNGVFDYRLVDVDASNNRTTSGGAWAGVRASSASYSFSGDSADAASEVLRQPGRVYLNPTATSGDPPYGGTALGRLERGAIFRHGTRVTALRCSEQARYPYDALALGSDGLVLEATLAQWSTDTVQVWFPGQTTTISTRRAVQFPGSSVPRFASDGDTFLLAFVPNDTTRHQALVLRKVVPYANPEQGLTWRVNSYGSLVALFLALPSGFATAAEDLGVIGKWSDLSLA